MKQQDFSQEEWLRVLTKGMITIPKAWRDDLGFKEGGMVKARKSHDTIVIEPVQRQVPYRIYSKAQLKEFLKSDKLPDKLSKAIDRKIGNK